MRFPVVIAFFMLIGVSKTYSQNNATADRAAYVKVITERADKIVAVLGITDAGKSEKVRNIIRDQYSDLNDIYTERDEKVKLIKAQYKDDKAQRDTALAVEARKVQKSLAKLHPKYIKSLNKNLSADQVEKVKNAMTYNVLPITYKAYQEQILTLNEAQKTQILAWLTEAREHAIDAESSDKKHAWFGKYKGRINNYLSAAGYDLKKEGEEWQKRIKAKAQNN
ncbi:DUF3826 domain-containing protein [Pedobacter rhizosphaerae]|uniref:DUF3826 domain-containing protein n=1 Tax=Pedobacter rhizosphaerae TaxID=390241 RepID=A0A1H9KM17_9SPHI|nr:DUF3826 domain-containing protein [Pedobacter rhizosphaerae]SEQ99965.1 Protein of unknown function [Pedobacter rhizosphaerae]